MSAEKPEKFSVKDYASDPVTSKIFAALEGLPKVVDKKRFDQAMKSAQNAGKVRKQDLEILDEILDKSIVEGDKVDIDALYRNAKPMLVELRPVQGSASGGMGY